MTLSKRKSKKAKNVYCPFSKNHKVNYLLAGAPLAANDSMSTLMFWKFFTFPEPLLSVSFTNFWFKSYLNQTQPILRVWVIVHSYDSTIEVCIKAMTDISRWLISTKILIQQVDLFCTLVFRHVRKKSQFNSILSSTHDDPATTKVHWTWWLSFTKAHPNHSLSEHAINKI